MQYSFELTTDRQVFRCGYYTYERATCHPDRTLGVHDLFYVLSGSIQVIVGEEEYWISGDDAAVLPAGIHHYGTVPGQDGTRCVFIHALPVDGDGLVQPAIGASATVETRVRCARQPAVRHLFEQAVDLNSWPSDQASDCFPGLFNMLLRLLAHAGAVAAQPRDDLVARACAMMSKHPSRFFPVEALAAELNTSVATLNRRFRDTYGCSVYRHQAELRLERVKVDLNWHADLGLREIAANNGFSDEFHLSKAFKRRFGMAPSDYRKCG